MRGWETNERVLESGGFESRQRVLVAEPCRRALGVGRALARRELLACGRRRDARQRARDVAGRGRPPPAARRRDAAPVRIAGAPARGRLVSCRYPIEGGLLALRAGGSVTLAQQDEGAEHELSVTVEEYLPRLAARAGAPWWTGALYAKGQSPFHAAVSRRYFELLVRGARREGRRLRGDRRDRPGAPAAARRASTRSSPSRAGRGKRGRGPVGGSGRRFGRGRAGRARQGRRRLLPRALTRRARLRAAGPGGGRERLAGGGRRGSSADRLSRRPRRRRAAMRRRTCAAGARRASASRRTGCP